MNIIATSHYCAGQKIYIVHDVQVFKRLQTLFLFFAKTKCSQSSTVWLSYISTCCWFHFIIIPSLVCHCFKCCTVNAIKSFKYSPTGESHTSHLLSVSPVSVLAYFKFHLLCVFLTYHPCATNSHHNSFFTLCFSSSCKGKTYWLLWVSEHCEFN